MEPQTNRVLPQNMTIICGFLEVNHTFVNPKNKIMKKLSVHPVLLALCISLLFVMACQKNNGESPLQNSSDLPETIVICVVSDVTAGSAVIKSENRFSQTSEIGICWSKTIHNPTIADLKRVNEGIKTVFTEAVENLEPETIYYVRAYAIQKGQPLYSQAVVFKTLRKPILKEKEL